MYRFTDYNNGRFPVVILLLLAPTIVSSYYGNYGVVTPLDPFLFVGDSLRLFCNITNANVREDSSRLYFEKVVDGSTHNESHPSQIFNTRVISLTVPEVELSDQASYTCLLRTLEGKSEIVGHQFVKVDVPPRSVTNVGCRVHNWETMTCTWDLGVRYNHPKHVNVSVVWVAIDIQQDCPQQTKTSCHWDQQHYKHGLSYNILIEVLYKFKGRVLKEARKIITVDSDEIVEPAPVENLRAVSRNSSCIVLLWQVPRVFLRSKRFIQQIRAPNGNWTDIKVDPTSSMHQHNSSHESWVCDLEPFTGYDFRIAVHPTSVTDGQPVGFRSQWRIVFARTQEDVPSAAPMTCAGCYFDLGDTSQDSDTPREVRIMWKNIPEAARRGRLTHYSVSFVGIDSNNNGSVIVRVADTELPTTSAILELPSWHEDYRVRIVGATRKGDSPLGSHILIPALAKQPPPPRRFLVKRNQDSRGSEQLFLSWAALSSGSHGRPMRQGHHARSVHQGLGSPSKRHSVKSQYIVWCQGSRSAWQCQDEIQWIQLPPEQVTYELVTDLTQVDPYDLLIGMSVQERAGANIVSSGIHWSTCVYTRDQRPQTAPLNVRISPVSADEDSLVVVWEKRGCRDETSYITEYLVRYCPSSSNDVCIGDRITLNVSSDVTNATLPHLARSTKYLVHVLAASSAGLGPPSEDIWHMLEPKPPDEDVSGLIAVVLSIVSVVFLLTFLFCFVRYCYRRKKKVPNVNKLLEIPTPQKCHPVNHYRGRPLPEPPANDVLVDHHTYGINSDLACMNNLGSEKKGPFTESSYSSSDCTNSNIPLMASQVNKDHAETGGGVALQLLPDKVCLIQAGNGPKPNDRDSVISTSGSIRRTSYSPTHTGDSYHRIVPVDLATPLDNAVSVATPLAMRQSVEWRNYPDREGQDLSTTDTLPYRSHWSAFPNASPPQHALPNHSGTTNFKTDPPIALLPTANNGALSYVMVGSALSPVAVNYTENLTFQPANPESVKDQEFCTCDCNSEDSRSVDLSENVLIAPEAVVYNATDFRPSIPIETIFSRIPPPHSSPSPVPPHDNAPSLPFDYRGRVSVNHRQQHLIDPVTGMGSQEYLEPQVVPSGYVFSMAS